MYLHFDICEKSVRNDTKQQRVDFAFIPISKEEREMDMERDFVALNEDCRWSNQGPKMRHSSSQ
jgi:hypothetical protein